MGDDEGDEGENFMNTSDDDSATEEGDNEEEDNLPSQKTNLMVRLNEESRDGKSYLYIYIYTFPSPLCSVSTHFLLNVSPLAKYVNQLSGTTNHHDDDNDKNFDQFATRHSHVD
jgi:hypothetical protein